MTVVRTSGFRVPPSFRPQAEELVAGLVAAVRAGEPGTRLFLALQDEAEPARFTLLGVYDDAEAEGEHEKAEWTRRFVNALDGHLVGSISRLAYKEVPASGGEEGAPDPGDEPTQEAPGGE